MTSSAQRDFTFTKADKKNLIEHANEICKILDKYKKNPDCVSNFGGEISQLQGFANSIIRWVKPMETK